MPSTALAVTALQPWISQCRAEALRVELEGVAISLAVHAPPRSCLFAKTKRRPRALPRWPWSSSRHAERHLSAESRPR